MPFSLLETRLHYEFRHAELLRQALTHRSHSAAHNERLEFLGDAVLNCAVAALLFQRFGRLDEGDLSRVRANLVKQQSLYEIAQALSVADGLRLGEGELRSGGLRRPSILADALEAIFGAIFLDGGFDAAQSVIQRLYEPILDHIDPRTLGKDAKTLLQEYLQGHKIALPAYTVVATHGAAHNQQFEVECAVPRLDVKVSGSGASRRAAEQAAAKKALDEVMAAAPTLAGRAKRKSGKSARAAQAEPDIVAGVQGALDLRSPQRRERATKNARVAGADVGHDAGREAECAVEREAGAASVSAALRLSVASSRDGSLGVPSAAAFAAASDVETGGAAAVGERGAVVLALPVPSASTAAFAVAASSALSAPPVPPALIRAAHVESGHERGEPAGRDKVAAPTAGGTLEVAASGVTGAFGGLGASGAGAVESGRMQAQDGASSPGQKPGGKAGGLSRKNERAHDSRSERHKPDASVAEGAGAASAPFAQTAAAQDAAAREVVTQAVRLAQVVQAAQAVQSAQAVQATQTAQVTQSVQPGERSAGAGRLSRSRDAAAVATEPGAPNEAVESGTLMFAPPVPVTDAGR